jgi:hypothetical protein
LLVVAAIEKLKPIIHRTYPADAKSPEELPTAMLESYECSIVTFRDNSECSWQHLTLEAFLSVGAVLTSICGY